jgi:hypothetical protein
MNATERAEYVLKAEVMPRVRFCESLAIRAALGLDGVDQTEALLHIAKALANADRHASST